MLTTFSATVIKHPGKGNQRKKTCFGMQLESRAHHWVQIGAMDWRPLVPVHMELENRGI